MILDMNFAWLQKAEWFPETSETPLEPHLHTWD